MHSSLLTLAILVLGCGNYARDIETICTAPDRAEFSGMDPAFRQSAMAAWIEKNIHSRKARRLFRDLAELGPEERVDILQREADTLGLAECAMVRAWRNQ